MKVKESYWKEGLSMQQNNKVTLTIFYTYVALLSSTDLMLLTGMIWFSLKVTGSPMLIGILLSVSVFLPFLAKKFIYRQKRDKTLKNMAVQRILIYAIIMLSSLVFSQHDLLNLMMWGILLGLSSFITNSTLEKHNTIIAMSGKLKYEIAARLMQTMVQIGACLGGILIYYLNILSFAQVISIISLLATISLLILWKGEHEQLQASEHENNESNALSSTGQFSKYTVMSLVVLSVGVGMIGFQISSFNILMPVVFQKVYIWNAVYLGIASAVAGVGSFCASLVRNHSKIVIIFAIILAVCDWIAGLAGTLAIVMVACFFIGFSMNYCRIALRQELMKLPTNSSEAEKIASFSTATYMCFQGVSPILVALILSALNANDIIASYLFGVIGIVVMLVIILSVSSKTLLLELYNEGAKNA